MSVARLASVLPAGTGLLGAPVLGSLAEGPIGVTGDFGRRPRPARVGVLEMTRLLAVLGSVPGPHNALRPPGR